MELLSGSEAWAPRPIPIIGRLSPTFRPRRDQALLRAPRR